MPLKDSHHEFSRSYKNLIILNKDGLLVQNSQKVILHEDHADEEIAVNQIGKFMIVVYTWYTPLAHHVYTTYDALKSFLWFEKSFTIFSEWLSNSNSRNTESSSSVENDPDFFLDGYRKIFNKILLILRKSLIWHWTHWLKKFKALILMKFLLYFLIDIEYYICFFFKVVFWILLAIIIRNNKAFWIEIIVQF